MKTSLAIAIACILTGASLMLVRQDPPAKSATPAPPPRSGMGFVRSDRALPTTTPSVAADTSTPSMPDSWSAPAQGGRRPAPGATKQTTSALSALPSQGVLMDPAQLTPMAREALTYVGTDVDANDFWASAINNPDLSADDRSNLIEDLNEAGFPDPQHVTSNDLPLIESRIALIETLAPDAMDATNAAAFDEAYKDLVKMRDDLQPQAATERGQQFNVR